MLKHIVGGLLVLGLAATMQSVSADQPLKGTYRGTLNTHCMESTAKFTPNLLFDLHEGDWGGKYTDTSLSTAVFADGKMTETVRGTTYFQGDPFNPFSLGAGTFESTCNYTVAANPNNSIVLTGSCSGFIPLGPATGQNVTVEGIIVKGQVSEDRSIIIIGSEEPNAQILKLFNVGELEPRYKAYRLCSSSSTYIRLK